MISSRFAVRIALVAVALLLASLELAQYLGTSRESQPHQLTPHQDELTHAQEPRPTEPQQPLSDVRIPCYGPRGRLLSDSPDDQLRPETHKIPYPQPLVGSYEALALDQTWMTAEARYGPYGFGEDLPEYNRSKVNWAGVNWADLQGQCLELNKARFQTASNITSMERFFLKKELTWKETWKDRFGISVDDTEKLGSRATGRTAIVLRSWDVFNYSAASMFSLRSIITETALASGGDYVVILLVHIRDKEKGIFDSREKYKAALEEFVPAELRGMVVLFDENLLQSWYPKVENHLPEYQMYQALQLLAYFYPEFDHFWQLEMDIKFLGNTRHYLDAVSNFAKTEPRKQARERASFFLMSAVHGAYSELLSAVNESLAGGGLWGPLRIPDIEPIGPSPPTKTPEEDDFSWGVGEEADLIVTNACFDVRKSGDWVYKDWIRGFTQGERTPRVSCPPAITRSSSTLLRAVHAAQTEQGLCVPSEATLPSFALWHGLKMSYPPQPWWQNPRRETAEMFRFFNGGWPSRENDGMAYGEAMYNAKWHYDITNSATWWWASEFPGQVFEAWYDGNGGNEGRGGEKGGAGKKEAELPYILRKQRGKTWAPNVAIHPVKLDR